MFSRMRYIYLFTDNKQYATALVVWGRVLHTHTHTHTHTHSLTHTHTHTHTHTLTHTHSHTHTLSLSRPSTTHTTQNHNRFLSVTSTNPPPAPPPPPHPTDSPLKPGHLLVPLVQRFLQVLVVGGRRGRVVDDGLLGCALNLDPLLRGGVAGPPGPPGPPAPAAAPLLVLPLPEARRPVGTHLHVVGLVGVRVSTRGAVLVVLSAGVLVGPASVRLSLRARPATHRVSGITHYGVMGIVHCGVMGIVHCGVMGIIH